MKEKNEEIEFYRRKLEIMNITKVAEEAGMKQHYRALLDFVNGKTMFPNSVIFLKIKEYIDENVRN